MQPIGYAGMSLVLYCLPTIIIEIVKTAIQEYQRHAPQKNGAATATTTSARPRELYLKQPMFN